MRKIQIVIIITIVLSSIITKSQSLIISGNIVDSSTGKKLAYANIMLRNEKLGVTSDSLGNFALFSDTMINLQNDTFVISYMGYKSKFISLNNYKNKTIGLQPDSIDLEEIIIRTEHKKNKPVIINAIKKRKCFLTYSPDSLTNNYWNPVRAKEPLIEAEYFPFEKKKIGNKITEISFYVTSFKIPSTFRLRIFNATGNKQPGKDLLTVPYIVKTAKSKQLIKINLKNLNIYIPENGIFIGFELLIIPSNKVTDNIENQSITFYSPFLNYTFTDSKNQYWIYTKGAWEVNNEKRRSSFIKRKPNKRYIKPAISIVVE